MFLNLYTLRRGALSTILTMEKQLDQTFGYKTSGKPALNLLALEETLIEVHWRMARVFIENLDYDVCIKKYDRSHTLFYIDPPYYGIGGYKYNLNKEDFLKMNDILSNIKGKFLLSLNDTKEVRKIFKKFKFINLGTKYTICNTKESRAKVRKELLIKNF